MSNAEIAMQDKQLQESIEHLQIEYNEDQYNYCETIVELMKMEFRSISPNDKIKYRERLKEHRTSLETIRQQHPQPPIPQPQDNLQHLNQMSVNEIALRDQQLQEAIDRLQIQYNEDQYNDCETIVELMKMEFRSQSPSDKIKYRERLKKYKTTLKTIHQQHDQPGQ
jgi:hypothetical protein